MDEDKSKSIRLSRLGSITDDERKRLSAIAENVTQLIIAHGWKAEEIFSFLGYGAIGGNLQGATFQPFPGTPPVSTSGNQTQNVAVQSNSGQKRKGESLQPSSNPKKKKKKKKSGNQKSTPSSVVREKAATLTPEFPVNKEFEVTTKDGKTKKAKSGGPLALLESRIRDYSKEKRRAKLITMFHGDQGAVLGTLRVLIHVTSKSGIDPPAKAARFLSEEELRHVFSADPSLGLKALIQIDLEGKEPSNPSAYLEPINVDEFLSIYMKYRSEYLKAKMEQDKLKSKPQVPEAMDQGK